MEILRQLACAGNQINAKFYLSLEEAKHYRSSVKYLREVSDNHVDQSLASSDTCVRDTVHDDVKSARLHFGKFPGIESFSSWGCSLCPDIFLSTVLLLVMIVVSVAVIVAVVVIVAVMVVVVVMVIVIVVSLVENPRILPSIFFIFKSESKALVPSFGFQLLGSIQWSS
ncbi:hypothetical protein Tco_0139508 [Tanacetum coccineum]